MEPASIATATMKVATKLIGINPSSLLWFIGGAAMTLGLSHIGGSENSQHGKLLVPAAPLEPLSINVFSLITKRSSVNGWYSGTAKDSQDTLEFSALSRVHPMIEKYPLDKVAEAYEQMHSGKVRFRVVLSFARLRFS